MIPVSQHTTYDRPTSRRLDRLDACADRLGEAWSALREANALRPDLPIGGGIASILVSAFEVQAERRAILEAVGLL
jgi:hypothetical protein